MINPRIPGFMTQWMEAKENLVLLAPNIDPEKRRENLRKIYDEHFFNDSEITSYLLRNREQDSFWQNKHLYSCYPLRILNGNWHNIHRNDISMIFIEFPFDFSIPLGDKAYECFESKDHIKQEINRPDFLRNEFGAFCDCDLLHSEIDNMYSMDKNSAIQVIYYCHLITKSLIRIQQTLVGNNKNIFIMCPAKIAKYVKCIANGIFNSTCIGAHNYKEIRDPTEFLISEKVWNPREIQSISSKKDKSKPISNIIFHYSEYYEDRDLSEVDNLKLKEKECSWLFGKKPFNPKASRSDLFKDIVQYGSDEGSAVIGLSLNSADFYLAAEIEKREWIAVSPESDFQSVLQESGLIAPLAVLPLSEY